VTLRRTLHFIRGRRVIALALTTAFTAGGTSPEPTEIVVGGDDYAFILADSVPSGSVRFAFENRGQVRHEMVLVQLAEGATLADVGEAVQTGGDPFQFISDFGGVLIAEPGTTAWGELQVDLQAGRTYAMLCNFQDTDDAPPHTELGMVKEFVVQ
jgi:hypothetical protein